MYVLCFIIFFFNIELNFYFWFIYTPNQLRFILEWVIPICLPTGNEVETSDSAEVGNTHNDNNSIS